MGASQPRPGSKLSVDNRTIDNWFNTDAFTLSTVNFGTSTRNPLVSPAIDVVNLAVMKNFAMPYNESASTPGSLRGLQCLQYATVVDAGCQPGR